MITAAAQQTFNGAISERTREIFVRLVQYLHDFDREVRLTSEEWSTAVDFPERVGHISSPTRQEFVLLSEILGPNVLVDQVNHSNCSSATDSTLLGPSTSKVDRAWHGCTDRPGGRPTSGLRLSRVSCSVGLFADTARSCVHGGQRTAAGSVKMH
ncbi:Catechol dioxygenase N terminus [Saccharopolyspora shandongensis]|uniref:Catechol dioxygenase N terminus n=1 Tax=Saccharopolyspora shandongensis TaxID=418495 RepID=A0A1H3NB00_9PSEU|nr:dioxygenase [Saccharopolyspora shandongensis]SDY85379.1 Catechol dioxygenase N terminus [Saccharopolyspora shandongensis]